MKAIAEKEEARRKGMRRNRQTDRERKRERENEMGGSGIYRANAVSQTPKAAA